MEKINIGCKLPHGLVLEVGLDMGNAKGTSLAVPGKDYKAVVLQGALKARAGAKFGSTLVPKAVWDTWLAKNAKLRYVVDGSVFVVN